MQAQACSLALSLAAGFMFVPIRLCPFTDMLVQKNVCISVTQRVKHAAETAKSATKRVREDQTRWRGKIWPFCWQLEINRAFQEQNWPFFALTMGIGFFEVIFSTATQSSYPPSWSDLLLTMPQLNQLGQVKLTQTMGTLVCNPKHKVLQKQSSSLQVDQTFHKVAASVHECPV